MLVRRRERRLGKGGRGRKRGSANMPRRYGVYTKFFYFYLFFIFILIFHVLVAITRVCHRHGDTYLYHIVGTKISPPRVTGYMPASGLWRFRGTMTPSRSGQAAPLAAGHPATTSETDAPHVPRDPGRAYFAAHNVSDALGCGSGCLAPAVRHLWRGDCCLPCLSQPTRWSMPTPPGSCARRKEA